MEDKIVPAILDTLRNTTLSQSELVENALMLLAWERLTSSGLLPSRLCLRKELLSDPAELQRVLVAMSRPSEEGFYGFENAERLGKLDPSVLHAIFGLILQLSESGILRASGFSFAPQDPSLSHLWSAFQPEVAELLLALAQIQPGESVYVPWDSGQLASEAAKQASSVYLETPTSSPIPNLLSVLADKAFTVHRADPIRSPSALENGKPRKFDVAVAFPPLGVRYDPEVFKRDWYSRFPERTTSGTVLSIRHLISQASRRVVVAVPNILLFSIGAELQLRQNLVDQGMVEAVISLPSGLLSGTNLPFSILVLDPAGGHSKIRFVDGEALNPLEDGAKSRGPRIDPKRLLELFVESNSTEYAGSFSTDEVLNKDAQLQVNRYVLPASSRKFESMFDDADFELLQDLVETVRPMPVSSSKDDVLEAEEIGAADIPPFGFIAKPGRTVLVDRKVAQKSKAQFLQPLDIVLIIKGSVGKVGIVPPDVPPAGTGGWVAGQSAIVLRHIRDSAIDPRVLAMQLRSPLGQERLGQIKSGASIPIIQLRELMHLPVLLPDAEVSKQAIAALEEETRLQQQIDHLRKLQSLGSANLWAPTSDS